MFSLYKTLDFIARILIRFQICSRTRSYLQPSLLLKQQQCAEDNRRREPNGIHTVSGVQHKRLDRSDPLVSRQPGERTVQSGCADDADRTRQTEPD